MSRITCLQFAPQEPYHVTDTFVDPAFHRVGQSQGCLSLAGPPQPKLRLKAILCARVRQNPSRWPVMVGENAAPLDGWTMPARSFCALLIGDDHCDCPSCQIDAHDAPSSLARGLEQVRLGQTVRRDDLLDERHVTRGEN